MYKYLTKNGQTMALLLGVFCILVFLIPVFTGIGSSGYDLGTDLNALPDEAKGDINFFNPGLALAVLLVVIGFAAAIFFGLFNFIKAPKESVKAAGGLLAIVVLFFILYATSQMESTGKLAMLHDKFDVTEGVSKFIGGGLKTTVILAVGAAAIVFLAEIRNFFK